MGRQLSASCENVKCRINKLSDMVIVATSVKLQHGHAIMVCHTKHIYLDMLNTNAMG